MSRDSNNVDFRRPEGIPQGVLLNTNNEALENYKKAKRRFNSVASLESKVDSLTKEIEELKRLIYDRISSTD